MSEINKVNDKGRSELHIAAYHQDLDWVKRCVSEGYDVNLKDLGGWLPLVWAIDMACTSEVGVAESIVDYLLQNGADFNIEPRPGESIIEFAYDIHESIGKYVEQYEKMVNKPTNRALIAKSAINVGLVPRYSRRAVMRNSFGILSFTFAILISPIDLAFAQINSIDQAAQNEIQNIPSKSEQVLIQKLLNTPPEKQFKYLKEMDGGNEYPVLYALNGITLAPNYETLYVHFQSKSVPNKLWVMDEGSGPGKEILVNCRLFPGKDKDIIEQIIYLEMDIKPEAKKSFEELIDNILYGFMCISEAEEFNPKNEVRFSVSPKNNTQLPLTITEEGQLEASFATKLAGKSLSVFIVERSMFKKP